MRHKPRVRDPEIPRDAKGRQICGAKRRDGGRCQQIFLYPNGRCKFHGGPSLHGAAHPNFKHGKYSAYTPKGLAEKYEQALNDPQLMTLRDNIALTDARIGELLEMLTSGVGKGAIGLLVKQKDELLAARARGTRATQLGNEEAVRAANYDASHALNALLASIDKIEQYTSTWDELLQATEVKRRLVESEAKRLKDESLMVAADELALMFARVLAVIRANVDDQEKLVVISNGISQIIGS